LRAHRMRGASAAAAVTYSGALPEIRGGVDS
jgi:hypothetical protein